MNRATRDKFAATTDQSDLTTGQATWETPDDVFQALHREFHFDIDLCGGPGTQHRLPSWFGPGSPVPSIYHYTTKDLDRGDPTDALSVRWRWNWKESLDGTGPYHSCQRGFANPPYGKFIPLLIEKALWEASHGEFTSVLLLPNRITKWYKKVMREARAIRVVDERITFWENGGPRINPKTGKGDGALFDSCVVVIGPGRNTTPNPMFPQAQFDIWHWDPERDRRCRLVER